MANEAALADQARTIANERKPRVRFDEETQGYIGDALYFIENADAGTIKIGRGFDPTKRLASLQTGNCRDLTLIDVIPNLGWQEAFWHCAWGTWRVRGEWFEAAPELREAIRAVRNPKPGEDWTDHVPPLVAFPCELGEWQEHMLDALDAYTDYAVDARPPMSLDKIAQMAIFDPDFDGRCIVSRHVAAMEALGCST